MRSARRSRRRAGRRRRAARVRALRERLRELYGVPARSRTATRSRELVLTVLSQSTNDRNRDVAYLRLRERMPCWDGGARRAGRGDRGGDPARRDLQVQKSGRIQEILAGARPRTRPRVDARRAGARRRASSWSGSRAWAARPRPASCSSPTGCATCPSTPTSRASGPGSACCARARRSTELHDPMLAVCAARSGARAAHEPAAPRPADLPRPAPACPAARCADVPGGSCGEDRARDLLGVPGGRRGRPGAAARAGGRSARRARRSSGTTRSRTGPPTTWWSFARPGTTSGAPRRVPGLGAPRVERLVNPPDVLEWYDRQALPGGAARGPPAGRADDVRRARQRASRCSRARYVVKPSSRRRARHRALRAGRGEATRAARHATSTRADAP